MISAEGEAFVTQLVQQMDESLSLCCQTLKYPVFPWLTLGRTANIQTFSAVSQLDHDVIAALLKLCFYKLLSLA